MSVESRDQSDWRNWKIEYVGSETFRVGEPETQGEPPPEAYDAIARLGFGGGYGGYTPLCIPWEFCRPDKIEIPLPTGTITIPIQVCRWVVICV